LRRFLLLNGSLGILADFEDFMIFVLSRHIAIHIALQVAVLASIADIMWP
jgi:hypothetical protein